MSLYGFKTNEELRDVLEDIQEQADRMILMIEPVFKRRMKDELLWENHY